jgi:hypothetical protein
MDFNKSPPTNGRVSIENTRVIIGVNFEQLREVEESLYDTLNGVGR